MFNPGWEMNGELRDGSQVNIRIILDRRLGARKISVMLKTPFSHRIWSANAEKNEDALLDVITGIFDISEWAVLVARLRHSPLNFEERLV